jgi:hypothetical protein
MKKLLFLVALCALTGHGATAQSRLLNALKKGTEVTAAVREIVTTVSEIAAEIAPPQDSVKVDTPADVGNTVTITETVTVTTPGRRDSIAVYTPGHTESRVTDPGGYSLVEKRTLFFSIDDPDGRLEVIDADLFDPSQFRYSLSVGVRDSRFPVERAYENFGDNITEDVRTKDYYFKHSAKALIVAERGETPADERDAVAKNYLHYVINAFVSDSAGNGIYTPDETGVKLIPRRALAEWILGARLHTDQEILSELDDGARHIAEYIGNHPPKRAVASYMGDPGAVSYTFEYRFYDQEMFLHAFIFSPVTLHYEMRTWYDRKADITFYACFYCAGYDTAGMRQTIGDKNYASARTDFKERNNLDFDLYPLRCLMLDLERMLRPVVRPAVIEDIYFPGTLTWFVNETPGETRTTTQTTTIKGDPPPEPPKPAPPTYSVSSNSAAVISGANIVDLAEDARYTYLAGSGSGTSKLWAVDKQKGDIREIYHTTHGDKGDRGDVKRLLPDGRGGVYVEFSNHPIMLLRDAALSPTKMVFADEWSNYYPRLKAVMPSGDVVIIRSGPENILVDSATGAIKATSKDMDFGDPAGKVAVTPGGTIWEPGKSQSYSLLPGFGATPTRLETGYDSPFKGRVNEIAVAPDGAVVMASNFGLHRTTDGGKTWKATKGVSDYGGFDRLAIDSRSEIWAAAGGILVRYDAAPGKVLFRTSEFDAVAPDGSPVKLQTAPRLVLVDSAGNLWIVGGTYGAQLVILFNPDGISGYTSLAAKKSAVIF